MVGEKGGIGSATASFCPMKVFGDAKNLELNILNLQAVESWARGDR